MIVLLSGGLDSAVVLSWALANRSPVRALTFRYNCPWNKKEVRAAEDITERLSVRHEIVGLPIEHSSIESPLIPGRNMIFLSIAFNQAKRWNERKICVGFSTTDGPDFPDCRRDFLAAANGVAQFYDITIDAPLIECKKGEIVSLGHRLGTPFELTHTCYHGRRPGCGQCKSCKQRRHAFKIAGLEDPVRYEVPMCKDV